jgi:hypothetical protein
MLRILFALIAFAVLSPAHAAPGPDPHRDWHSASTAHFRVNYATPQRPQAERIADIAERVYAQLSKQLQWEPSSKIEIMVLDEFDVANGFSTPLPFNETAIFLTPPDDGELLDNSIWLEMLLTHELTHIFHLDKVRGTPNVLQHIFGRNPLLFPNLWQPTWAIEGIATYNESTPELGQGRLRGPMFEALMRIEHEHGFKSLSEMNADGRALPTSKEYLYGVYFYDFLARKYGSEAIYNYIYRYSGNPPLVPRVDTNPLLATGMHMGELWDEFIADMNEQMSRREAPIKETPRADGNVILPANFSIDSLAPVSDGALAVVDDGRLQPKLVHIDAQGKVQQLAKVNSGAHIDVRADGKVLIAQPDICGNFNYYYDLYTWSAASDIQRKTHCGRYRRAVWMGEQIAALHIAGGISSLVVLEQHGSDWRESRKLYETPNQVEAIDLAASPDGKHIALSIKQANAWQVLEFDSAGGSPRVLFNHNAPVYGLRYARTGDGLEFIAAKDGVFDLWHFSPGATELTRLSHTYTAVLLHSGIAQDGSTVLGVLAAGGTELRRMQTTAPLAQIKLASSQTTVLQRDTPPVTNKLGESGNYHALYSLYPRTWLPSALVDRGLSAYGASTYGSDVMGWHNYTADVMWETSQHEAIGSFSYDYLGEHSFSFTRNLQAREWTGSGSNQTTTVFDRTTDAQWVSMLPWLQLERRIYPGIGASLKTTERVQVPGALATQTQNERVAATFLRYDTRNTNWYADSANRGNLSTLLYESYRPFHSFYNGYVSRFDTLGYLPLGETVFSARWTEARAHGTTEPFQLGGATGYALTQAPMLNQRNLPLRGYEGSEAVLLGQNARTASIEWRMPLADVDRHSMTPPVGLNRLSASVFMDAGGVWDNGNSPSKYYRSVGIELNSEVKLLYMLAIPLRLGIAHGMEDPGKVRAYLQLGQSF